MFTWRKPARRRMGPFWPCADHCVMTSYETFLTRSWTTSDEATRLWRYFNTPSRCYITLYRSTLRDLSSVLKPYITYHASLHNLFQHLRIASTMIMLKKSSEIWSSEVRLGFQKLVPSSTVCDRRFTIIGASPAPWSSIAVGKMPVIHVIDSQFHL